VFDSDYTAQDHSYRENDHYARAKYGITLRWLGDPGMPPRRLVNIGCGAGLFNRLAHDAGFAVDACEPDPAAHAIAAATAPAGLAVHLGGLFDAPIAPGADIVVMHDVLEHVENDHAAVDRLAEILAADGQLIVSVPALPRLFGLHDEMLGHYRRYERRGLERVLGRRFEVSRMRYFGFVFIPVTAWYSRWRRRPYPTAPAGSSSWVGSAFDVACRAEGRVPMPIGTSLLADARRLRREPRSAG
jgi:SAM-dependent methyltransferase